ncbi:hypothetical protein TEU_04870 [Thermococcus eurythermalis]|uniref:Uncharacterized protein n=1 Tax=Thermococcus eurythermalis TaxID=1505907 RepID=A0A097QTB4_9EURY|nr:hypothetical protein [Thermococcus eurythermalis]AIU69720.1 hypothetical protein TEU_04870 [Thermococcus eurythermalis]
MFIGWSYASHYYQGECPQNTDPEELKRLLELELPRKELVKEKKRPKGDFRKLRRILGKAEFGELKAYELEAEFSDLY